jgi:alkaline phosphatase
VCNLKKSYIRRERKGLKQRLVVVLLAVVLLSTSVIGGVIAQKEEGISVSASSQKAESKNLIILIGDGMGPAQVTLARLYAQKYLGQEKLALDDILVGMNSTYAGDSSYKGQSGIVTDSAAAGTAFAAGYKTYNGAISITNEDVAKPVASIVEAAENIGKATGLISTARITHATPAVYATHVRQRGMENAIASQYLKSGVDVLLGGGERHFVASEEEATYGKTKRKDNIDLVSRFKDAGYDVVYNKEQLLNASGGQLLGFFDDSHVPYNLDRESETPNLSDQLSKAIEVLEKDEDGFVLMMEGGRIDHAGHANDIHSIVKETLEFDAAVKVALDYAKEHPKTSVMITADHETGGLTIGRNNYDAYMDVFNAITSSSSKIGKELKEATDGAAVRQIVQKYTGIQDLTDQEVQLILEGKLWDGTPSSYGREGGFNSVIAKRASIGWTGHTHTGVDVGVYAYGPVADDLVGFMDNTKFATLGAKTIGADLEAATAKLQAKYMYPKFMIDRNNQVLFPAKSLGQALGVKVIWNAKTSKATFEGTNKKIVIDPKNVKVMIDGKKVEGTTDNGSIYLPLEAFEALTGKELEWDEVSERIVLP